MPRPFAPKTPEQRQAKTLNRVSPGAGGGKALSVAPVPRRQGRSSTSGGGGVGLWVGTDEPTDGSVFWFDTDEPG